MNIYPALRLHMGDPVEGWTYYVIKMKMKDIGKEIRFAGEFSGSKTLNEVIQRQLDESRVKKQMVNYLASRDDRFYSSIVVAALEGSPTWIPMQPVETDELGVFEEASKHFGLLKFDGGQKYYALDGQHRVKSIQTLLDTSEEPPHPAGFENEEISVIIMTTTGDSGDDWVTKYRRLFSSLNRYAKPVDKDTTIIMDEDDLFAILTRQMIEQYPFMVWTGDTENSPKVKTKGNTLGEGEPYFITLQTLYAMNEILLRSPENEDTFGDMAKFKQSRPDEDFIQKYYEELTKIWDAMIAAIPDLSKDPIKMRVRNNDALEADDDMENNALFTPIVMKGILAPALLYLMVRNEDHSKQGLIQTFSKLNKIDWSLLAPPWRNLLANENNDGKWIMTSEERAKRIALGLDLVLWIIGITELDDDDVNELKQTWSSYIMQTSGVSEEMWEEVLAIQSSD